MHKALLPLDASDIAAFVAMVVGGSISFVGGIGGGGIFVPIFLLAGKFSLHEAVPLSKSAIFVGAAMTTLLNLCKEHPTEERPLIDFDAATLFLPSVLAGTSVGVLLNVVLPQTVTLILLALFLTLNVVNSSLKGMRLWRVETEKSWLEECDQTGAAREELLESGADPEDAYQTPEMSYHGGGQKTQGKNKRLSVHVKSLGGTVSLLQDAQEFGPETEFPPVNESLAEGAREHELRRGAKKSVANLAERIMAMAESGHQEERFSHPPLRMRRKSSIVRESFHRLEARKFPRRKVLLCVCVLATLLCAKVMQNKQEKCSLKYWVLFAIPFLVCVAVVVPWARHLSRKHTKKVEAHYVFAEGDIQWGGGQGHQPLFIPPIVFFAGLLAGLLGIGGGLVITPTLLQLGVKPEVSAATSTYMVFFTSTATAAQYLILGDLDLDYAGFFCCATLLGAILGDVTIGWLIRKTGRKSLLLLILCFATAVSAVLVAVQAIIGQKSGGQITMKEFC